MRAFRIAYDGRDYNGFQRQPDVPTVSDAILDALGELDVLDARDAGASERAVPPGYAAAGRTDAGVSAVAQTVAFEAPDWLRPAALNAELPADVRAWASADAPDSFHATHDATRRTYTYYLHAPEADVEAASEAAGALSGRHDVHNLTPGETGTVRDLSVAVEREGPFLVLTVTAGGFPRQLVRRLVTVVSDVATGVADMALVERVLGDDALVGPDGIPPAPPEPLVLSAVVYPGLSFEIDPNARTSARDVFEQRRVEHATAARVAGDLAAVGRDTGNTGR